MKKKITYRPTYSRDELKKRLQNLRHAIDAALCPLQTWEDSANTGAEEIAYDEASYVMEMIGFLELMKLVEYEELAGSIDSVNKACWEIEVACEKGAAMNHPWQDGGPEGFYETTVFHCGAFKGFNSCEYGPTSMEATTMEELQEAWKSAPLLQPDDDDPLSGF